MIRQAVDSDWRIRFFSIQQARECVNLVHEFSQNNDLSSVKIAISVFGKLIDFSKNCAITQESDIKAIKLIYEQITQMLLLFVRANDADKNVILDSVYLVRKIVKLFPCD